jgi:hypothetical protein
VLVGFGYEGGLIMGDGQVGKTEDENRTLLRTKATRAKKQMFRNRPTSNEMPFRNGNKTKRVRKENSLADRRMPEDNSAEGEQRVRGFC